MKEKEDLGMLIHGFGRNYPLKKQKARTLNNKAIFIFFSRKHRNVEFVNIRAIK